MYLKNFQTLTFLILVLGVASCKDPLDKTAILQHRIDSLEIKLHDVYKPGLGEFMSSIQVHHNKLWFAGLNENWKLADFEIHEIKEAMDNIEKYQTERDETKYIGMIRPVIDKLDTSIQMQSKENFRESYIALTKTCNKCHETVKFEFNVVQIPTSPIFSNQNFGKISN